jgi:hypothetical protein
MAEVSIKNITTLKLTDTSGAVAEGFLSASLANLGSADGTITQNGNVITLAAGAVFNFPQQNGNNAWGALTINATGTIIECVYY